MVHLWKFKLDSSLNKLVPQMLSVWPSNQVEGSNALYFKFTIPSPFSSIGTKYLHVQNYKSTVEEDLNLIDWGNQFHIFFHLICNICNIILKQDVPILSHIINVECLTNEQSLNSLLIMNKNMSIQFNQHNKN